MSFCMIFDVFVMTCQVHGSSSYRPCSTFVHKLLRVKSSDSTPAQGSMISEGNPASQCDASGESSPRTGYDFYKLYSAPSGSEAIT
jgi:hypothetical protein